MMPLLLVVVAMLLASSEAFACDGILPTFRQLIQNSKIFVGVVSDKTSDEMNSTVTFTDVEFLSGEPAKSAVVVTPVSEGACGRTFLKGKKYLVFGHPRQDGVFEVGSLDIPETNLTIAKQIKHLRKAFADLKRPVPEAQAVVKQANSLTNAGKPADAIQLLKSEGYPAPVEPSRQLELGRAYARIQKYDEAIDAIDEYSTLRPDDWLGPYNRLCYMAKAKSRRAKAVEWMAYTFKRFEKDPKALDSMRKMLARDPDVDSIRSDAKFQALMKPD